jgi:hypothetical protein
VLPRAEKSKVIGKSMTCKGHKLRRASFLRGRLAKNYSKICTGGIPSRKNSASNL